MGNIIADIVEEIDVKPAKSKLYIKWIISIAVSLISIAFVFGQFKASFFNRMDGFETSLVKNTAAISNLNIKIENRFDAVDTRIDKVYSDGLVIFNDFQEYNNKQLELVIDYGSGNKDMLKRMLEIGSLKQQQEVKNQVEAAKIKEPVSQQQPEIAVRPFKEDYISIVHFIEVETNDTIFGLTGATKEYINKIDRNRYQVGAITQNEEHPNLFDVSYRNK